MLGEGKKRKRKEKEIDKSESDACDLRFGKNYEYS